MWKSCVKTHASGKFLPRPPPPSGCYLKLPLLCIRLMLLVQKSNSFLYLERLRAPGLLPADGTQVSWKCYCPEGRKSRNACKHSVIFVTSFLYHRTILRFLCLRLQSTSTYSSWRISPRRLYLCISLYHASMVHKFILVIKSVLSNLIVLKLFVIIITHLLCIITLCNNKNWS